MQRKQFLSYLKQIADMSNDELTDKELIDEVYNYVASIKKEGFV